ncbi:DUF4097 family beta strand repeat-containing protein [Paenibacillus roseipurpureus]|uniref:DUF4097 family beta strand repeat-containing protein n=1 Tax=Paenibacillus roseopurpureus TaxID=2918901 RepID=A0AA96LUW5_9BACL|nr:DUF4097 family beta strand repeat-containing protein [Paenibacillus sp. MBLB1832]WNR46479.1 DUF4097 family beta strand repeat-containing protein [Paenibacillus sp. MBLB1832]
MSFRQKRIVLLSTVGLLFLLSILDITFRKEEVFEAFSKQFVNEEKMDAYLGARRAVTATVEHQAEINLPELKEVMLASQVGKVSVQRSESSAIRVKYTVTATASDTEAANRKRDAVKVDQQVQNGQLTLVTGANGKPIDPDDISIDYVLSIPDAMKVTIQNENGAVRISGVRAGITASSVNGIMEIVDVKGELHVKSSYGSLYLADITGNINLVNRSSQVNVHHTQGDLVLDHQSGHTNLTSLTGKITGNAEYGSMLFRELKGSIDVTGRSTDMQFDQLQGDTRVVSNAGGQLTFILAKDEGYTLDAAVNGGRILSLLTLPIQKVKDSEYESHMNGVVGNGTRKIEAKVKSGDITFQVN